VALQTHWTFPVARRLFFDFCPTKNMNDNADALLGLGISGYYLSHEYSVYFQTVTTT